MKPISKLEVEVEDVQTEILMQSFSDRVFILVTQLGKVGCLIQAAIPQSVQLSHPPASTSTSTGSDGHEPENEQHNLLIPTPPPSIALTPLFGQPPSPKLHTYYSLLASQLSTLVWFSEEAGGSVSHRRPVIVGIALKRREGDDTLDESPGNDRDGNNGIVNAVQSLLN
ncbi:uncharacterized protein EI90DRAFT_3051886 [Cantharellus anzutake]|uniref:uncharacterized protein n=1 Tax=Cantharellus anzutake TaxID=1750568 RepID=UPI001908C9C0|nr:uncharacterized protein EI90DRAFT_3051886 [Cantharellus anzutake]KAF8334341.1 hypothetical protein EI90DRAFT_3051886 [Cantharellus anzutake]